MKTPWLPVLCVAALHFPATAQSLLSLTNIPALSGDKMIQDSRLPATDALSRADEQRVQRESSSLLSGDSLRWQEPQAETVPSISIRGREFPVSGFLVNPFASPARGEEHFDWGERLFPIKKSRWLITESASGKRAPEYFKWGERDEPWDVVTDRSRRAPEGVLFSLHF
jgi:hypothetical protein